MLRAEEALAFLEGVELAAPEGLGAPAALRAEAARELAADLVVERAGAALGMGQAYPAARL